MYERSKRVRKKKEEVTREKGTKEQRREKCGLERRGENIREVRERHECT